tara:strand:+ start:126 stop:644 length:519 start_codon:yes stop_codon:yes gene_type:complete
MSSGVSRDTLTLIKQLSSQRYSKVLDAGAGLGAQSEAIMQGLDLKGEQYLGTDVSSSCVEKAKRQGMNCVCDDLRVSNPAFTSEFDLVIAIKILYYCAPEIDITLENIRSYLRPGGVLCYVYNETPESFSLKWLSLASLRERLESGFSLEYSEESVSGNEVTAVDIWKINDA